MDWNTVATRPSVVLESLVIALQVLGMLALCLSRLHVAPRWVERGQLAVVVALVGLGVAGALCGRLDSEFGPFAGLSMTTILIGMIVGGGGRDLEDPHSLLAAGPEGHATS